MLLVGLLRHEGHRRGGHVYQKLGQIGRRGFRVAQRQRGEPLPQQSADAQPYQRIGQAALSAVTRLPTMIRCECPQHLADLLFRLSAFEAYSADCENRNENDAALHAHLHRETAKARVVLEEALEHLMRCEEIDLAAIQALA